MGAKQLIRKLTAQGVSQKQIAARLNRSRGFVHVWQKRLKLTKPYRGPRKPMPSAEQEREILRLLETMGRIRVAAKVGFSDHTVRAVERKHGFRRAPGTHGWKGKVDPETREKLIEEIKARRNHAKRIAERDGVPYKRILKMAHSVFGAARFRSGHGGSLVPFESRYPQKPEKRKSPLAHA